jgi:hypothetical protein
MPHKEFVDNCVSWRFFQHKIDFGMALKIGDFPAYTVLLLLEILKELPFMNDSKK